MFKRLIVLLAIVCALGIGFLAGSSDIDLDLSVSLGPSSGETPSLTLMPTTTSTPSTAVPIQPTPTATDPSQDLTEEQAIDVLAGEFQEVYSWGKRFNWELFGCLVECQGEDRPREHEGN